MLEAMRLRRDLPEFGLTTVALTTVACVSISLGCTISSKEIGQLDGDTGTEDSDEDSDDTTEPDIEDTGTDSEDTDSDTEDTDSDTEDSDSDSEDTGISPACSQAVDAVSELFEDDGLQSCAIVIRNSYQSGEFLGWSRECRDNGPAPSLGEALALSTWGGTDISQSEHDYVLYAEPGDFGGLAVVGEHSGLVFDAGIVWAGTGDINVPNSVAEPATLGPDCFSPTPGFALDVWSYDVTNSEDPFTLSEASELTLDALWSSAVFYGLQGTPATVSLLVYPRTMGAFDPSTAEIITIIDPL